eukprot:scaffold3618_cov129-Cylindrotheca_fusiformis.AAC.34
MTIHNREIPPSGDHVSRGCKRCVPLLVPDATLARSLFTNRLVGVPSRVTTKYFCRVIEKRAEEDSRRTKVLVAVAGMFVAGPTLVANNGALVIPTTLREGTGLTHDKKTQFHEMIKSLGGRYTRAFDLDKNTHLVAEAANGAKYDLAVTCPRIYIVKPSWIVACSREGKRVDESLHNLFANGEDKQTSTTVASEIDSLLSSDVGFYSLFSCHRFYLLGFDDDIVLKKKLGKLIRRGMAS